MSGDCRDQPVIFYSEEMTLSKMILLHQQEMSCELYECEVDGEIVACQIVEMSDDQEEYLIQYYGKGAELLQTWVKTDTIEKPDDMDISQ